jgi:hypothetical protein
MQEHLAGFGFEPVRWSAVDAGVSPTIAEHQLAICQSYAELLAALSVPALVVQDDVRLARFRECNHPLVALNRPVSRHHLCPKAFLVDPSVSNDMAAAFRKSDWACKTMSRLVDRFGMIREMT